MSHDDGVPVILREISAQSSAGSFTGINGCTQAAHARFVNFTTLVEEWFGKQQGFDRADDGRAERRP
jgi:hypothetical protein